MVHNTAVQAHGAQVCSRFNSAAKLYVTYFDVSRTRYKNYARERKPMLPTSLRDNQTRRNRKQAGKESVGAVCLKRADCKQDCRAQVPIRWDLWGRLQDQVDMRLVI